MIDTTILHYKILEKLGEGGMGEVYKARDTKLDRFVALKFLPSNLTATENEKARFIQEARAASALNHPNICTIHDIQEYDGQLFIVMEYVDGEILRGKRNLSVKQVIDLGAQAAEGLAAAHERGIVHRDIKPENIMLMKNGLVKVMDFGLAKLNKAEEASRLTKAGMTLGTVGYMSPEQVQGQDVDGRSDIFSLGVVLYELLSGESPFKGVHETAIMYEIVNVDPPPISTLKEGIDQNLDEIIFECLEKDKDDRYQSAKELVKDLRKARRSSGHRMSQVYSTQALSPAGAEMKTKSGVFDANFKRRILRNRVPISIISILVVALLALTFFVFNTPRINSGRPLHLSANIKEGLALGPFSSFAISPDGSKMVYVVNKANARMLYLRTLDSYKTTPIPGTEGAISPVFSPDGKWLAYWSDDEIKKVLISGGPVTSVFIITVPTHPLPYLFWGADNEIYFSLGVAGGIYRVSADGGQPGLIAGTGSSKGQVSYRWPVLLPDGNHLMFTAESEGENTSSRVLVRSLKDGKTKTIVDNAEFANYVNPGYLLLIRNGALYASKFDPGDLALKGPLIPVLTDVTIISQTGQPEFSLSDNGTMIYLPGTTLSNDRDLAWVDRSGKIIKSTDLHRPIEDCAISPDGKEVAVTIEGAAWNIWIYDVGRNTLSRLTYGTDARDPLWTPDGRSIIFDSYRDGYYGLYHTSLDNLGKETRLVKSNYFVVAYSISKDGKYVAYTQADSLGNQQILVKALKGNASSRIIDKAPFNREYPMFSPNGEYLAYTSWETPSGEIHVIPLDGSGSDIQISTNGGYSPFWSSDGTHLYYVQGEGKKLMEAPVSFSPGFAAGTPREVFSNDFGNNTIRPFQQVPGTKEFMMLKTGGSDNSSNTLNVILNWNKEMQRKVASAN